MSHDPIAPDPDSTSREPAAEQEPIAEPTPATPFPDAPSTGVPYAGGTSAMTGPGMSVTTTATTHRWGPWWAYVAIGLAGLLVGCIMGTGVFAVVSHIGHRGDRGFIQQDNRGRYGRFPGQYGPPNRQRGFPPGQTVPAPTPTSTG